jgi:hypothetical protein
MNYAEYIGTLRFEGEYSFQYTDQTPGVATSIK